MRLIDGDKAVKEIEEMASKPQIMPKIYLARNIVRDAPTVNEWIPCSERLPKDDEYVLVCGEQIEYPCIITKGEHIKHWSDYGYGFAWMPLPEPYKGGGK